MRTDLIALAFIVPLGACSTLQNDVQRGYALSSWSGGAAFTTSTVRVITQRKHPVFQTEVDCTEPSPDVAQALSSATSVKAQGGNGTVSAGLGASAASAEAVAELAGRSTALIGLRDGLYRACEAYANGALGQNAYALVISRYGQLMTTLFLGQDIAGVVGAEGKAAAAAAAVQADAALPPLPTLAPPPAPPASSSTTTTTPGAATTTTTTTESPPKATTSSGGQAPVQPELTEAVWSGGAEHAARRALLIPASSVRLLGLTATEPPPRLQLVTDTPGPAAPGPGGSDAGSSGQTTPPKVAAAPDPSATAAALALTRTNEDYMEQSIVDGIIVSCINNDDPSLPRPPSSPGNAFLNRICGELNMSNIMDLVKLQAKYTRPPVTPEAAAGWPSPAASPPPAAPPAPAAPACVSTKAKVKVPVTAYQALLKAAGLYTGALDGKAGSKTKAALIGYQKAQKLCPSGVADQETLAKMKLASASAAG